MVGTAWDLYINPGKTNMSTMLISFIHEHGIVLYFVNFLLYILIEFKMFLHEVLIDFYKVLDRICCYLLSILISIIFSNWLLLVKEKLDFF